MQNSSVRNSEQKLLFFMSQYSNSQKNAIAPTLQWISEVAEIDFELYYSAYHEGYSYPGGHYHHGLALPEAKVGGLGATGSTVMGGYHHQQFNFLNNVFDGIYAVWGDVSLFSSQVKLFSKKVIAKEDRSISNFYQVILNYLGVPVPNKIVIINNEFSSEFMPIGFDAYCYPEIYYEKALGVGSSTSVKEFEKFKEMGIQNVYALHVKPELVDRLQEIGFKVKVGDELKKDDTYWSLTSRMAKKWISKVEGISFTDPTLTSYWIPWLCRHNQLAVFEWAQTSQHAESQFTTKSGVEEFKKLFLKTKQDIVFGRIVGESTFRDLSKAGRAYCGIDPGRPCFPIIEKIKYPFFDPGTSYFEHEPSDIELDKWMNEGRILSTTIDTVIMIGTEYLFRTLDLVATRRIKIGAGCLTPWWKYSPELAEMITIPVGDGGVFPYVEPILKSCGLGIIREVDIAKDPKIIGKYVDNVKKSMDIVREALGEKFVPRGIFFFLDVDLNHTEAPPICVELYDALSKTGLEYALSFCSCGSSRIVYRKDNFIVINQSMPYYKFTDPWVITKDAIDCEMMELNQWRMGTPGWIIGTLDLTGAISPYIWFNTRGYGASSLGGIAEWLNSGGKYSTSEYTDEPHKPFINVTPHVIARYAKLLDDKKLISKLKIA